MLGQPRLGRRGGQVPAKPRARGSPEGRASGQDATRPACGRPRCGHPHPVGSGDIFAAHPGCRRGCRCGSVARVLSPPGHLKFARRPSGRVAPPGRLAPDRGSQLPLEGEPPKGARRRLPPRQTAGRPPPLSVAAGDASPLWLGQFDRARLAASCALKHALRNVVPRRPASIMRSPYGRFCIATDKDRSPNN